MLISLPSWKSRLKKMIKYLSGNRRIFTACRWLGRFLSRSTPNEEGVNSSLFCVVYERVSAIAGVFKFIGRRVQQRRLLRSVPNVRHLLIVINSGEMRSARENWQAAKRWEKGL